MSKSEELLQGGVRKRQATKEEIKMIRELAQEEQLTDWEEDFVKSLWIELVKIEEVGLKSAVMMLSEKQSAVLARISLKVANEALDEYGFDRDSDW